MARPMSRAESSSTAEWAYGIECLQALEGPLWRLLEAVGAPTTVRLPWLRTWAESFVPRYRPLTVWVGDGDALRARHFWPCAGPGA